VRRPRIFLVASALALAFGTLAAAPAAGSAPPAARNLRTRNVVLVSADGLRIQEMFGGMDPIVSGKEKHSGIYDLERARRLYWRPTAEERRQALMPFFWGTLAPQGIVLGNKEKGSHVTLRNPHWFSYPGYSEILTGQFQPNVTSNDPIRYNHRTVLEHVHERLRLPFTGVALIGSWDTFDPIASSREGAFFVNAGEQPVPERYSTPRMRYLATLQSQALTLWEGSRLDAFSVEMALEYLRQHRPRLLYVALGDTDEWAHARRYDRLLDQIHVFDESLSRLWKALDASETYRGRTTLIVTTDHGRPATPKDWVEHGEGLPGSEDIWIAVIGPDTPDRGETAPYPTVHQADIAATILGFFGLDPKEFNPQAGPAIPLAYGRPHPGEGRAAAAGAGDGRGAPEAAAGAAP
jgi:hypothetical protein